MPSDEHPAGPPWTVLNTLHWTTGYFKRHGLEHARIDAEMLMAHMLRCERIDLYLQYDRPLNKDELAGLKQLIKRRVQREPVAYIVGVKEFWSLDFEVTPNVLIPRPDTETLVEVTLDLLPSKGTGSNKHIFELGTGSGAITLALAHERPYCHYLASDRSISALAVAHGNAHRLGLDHCIDFIAGHWFAPLRQPLGLFDIIVSNPPYIPTADIARLAPEINAFEPTSALDGGAQGLDSIKYLINHAPPYLTPTGSLILEIGFDQRDAVEQLGRRCEAYDSIDFHKDYNGHDRVVHMRKGAQG